MSLVTEILFISQVNEVIEIVCNLVTMSEVKKEENSASFANQSDYSILKLPPACDEINIFF